MVNSLRKSVCLRLGDIVGAEEVVTTSLAESGAIKSNVLYLGKKGSQNEKKTYYLDDTFSVFPTPLISVEKAFDSDLSSIDILIICLGYSAINISSEILQMEIQERVRFLLTKNLTKKRENYPTFINILCIKQPKQYSKKNRTINISQHSCRPPP